MKIHIMKIHRKKTPVDRGSALTVTLLTCMILGAVLVACLSLIGTQQSLVCRSQNWNQAIVVAEGGVEEAMALLNSGSGPGDLDAFSHSTATSRLRKARTSPRTPKQLRLRRAGNRWLDLKIRLRFRPLAFVDHLHRHPFEDDQ